MRICVVYLFLSLRLFYVRIDERSKFATAAVAGACRQPRIDIGERDRNAAVTVVMRAVVVTAVSGLL